MTADFSQIEFRVAAALVDEPTMKANIHAGIDLHNVTARRLFGEGFTDAQRGVAKAPASGVSTAPAPPPWPPTPASASPWPRGG